MNKKQYVFTLVELFKHDAFVVIVHTENFNETQEEFYLSEIDDEREGMLLVKSDPPSCYKNDIRQWYTPYLMPLLYGIDTTNVKVYIVF